MEKKKKNLSECFNVLWFCDWKHTVWTVASSRERGWQRHLCVQLSEGGEAALPSSQEEKEPSRDQWEPKGLECEQQGPATENPQLRERTGKTWWGGAPRDPPFCEPQNHNANPNIGAHQTSRRLKSHLNLTRLWAFLDFCAGNWKKPVLTVI